MSMRNIQMQSKVEMVYSERQKKVVIARSEATWQSHEIASSRRAGFAMTIFMDVQLFMGSTIESFSY